MSPVGASGRGTGRPRVAVPDHGTFCVVVHTHMSSVTHQPYTPRGRSDWSRTYRALTIWNRQGQI